MTLLAYINPYYKQDFLGFFLTLIQRFISFCSGNVEIEGLVADELQMLVLVGVAISSSIVGTFLVLRRMTMLANSLSHTILLGIVLAYILTHNSADGHDHQGIDIQAMMIAAVVTGILTTFLTEFLTTVVRLQEDASTGLVFSTMFALGIILISMYTRNAHIGAEVVMGNVDALHIDDLKLVYTVVLLNIFVFTAFFKEFKITSFDTQLAKSLGISTVFFNYLLMVNVSATSIGAFRAVGVLMVLTFIVGPPLIARLLTDRLGKMLFISSVVGIVSSVTGVALSRHLLSIYYIPLSTAGLVVCVIAVFYILALVVSPSNGLIAGLLNRFAIKKDLLK
ncbi:MAG: manganese/zinc/iron transport system permease protein [Chlamydiales bacterium]|jgi:manganese/zinc/iron transport system permease protein